MLSLIMPWGRRPGRHAALTQDDRAHIEWLRKLRATEPAGPRRSGRVALAARRADGGAR